MSESHPLGNALVAVAIIAAGALIGGGLVRFRAADRAVTVRGVSERDVKADIGFWPLRFVASDDLLARAQQKIETDRRTVLRFLGRYDIDSSMVTIQGLEVQDNQANAYGGSTPRARYIINLTLIARSTDPERIRRASQAMSELVDAGVVLQSGPYGGPSYAFTKLNDLKPAMVAEATASARQAAEEFAKQSKSKVGGLRRGSQGVFEILPRDQAQGIEESSQIDKRLRVVTSLEYALTN